MIQPVSQLPSHLPCNADRLRVLPLTDLHLPKPAGAIIAANRALLDSVDYVVLMGDMVSAYATDREYQAVRAFIEQLRRPYTAVVGNHEFHFEEFDEDSGLYGQVWNSAEVAEQRANIEKFQRFYGLQNLWRAFDSPLGRFVFCSLDGIRCRKQEALSDEQSQWLTGQIRTAGERPIFIFCHAPLMLNHRLDMTYYDDRTGCIEPQGDLKNALLQREAPTFWMSGHVHLHPDHYLSEPYKAGGAVWQIHCPDSWGYGRWRREQHVPEKYDGPFSRVLEIDATGVSFVTHSHREGRDTRAFRVDYRNGKATKNTQRRKQKS